MKKRLICLLALTGLLATLTGCSGQSASLRFGTGGTGGVYYAYGCALTDALSSSPDTQLYTVKTTAGSAANLRLLSDKLLDLAIAQSDMTGDAYYGTGTFADQEPGRGYSAVASLYTEACQIVVRADSGIERVEDLEGHAVSVGEAESGVMQNARQILLAHGLSFDLLDTRNLSFSDAAAALGRGEIDAFFCTAGVPTAAVTELAEKTDIRLVSLEQEKLDLLTQRYDTYSACVIPAGTYAGQTEDVNAVGVRAVLLASDELDADRVYDITAALFENAEALQSATPADTPLTLESAGEGVTIPYHAGAAQYYAENGIQVETEVTG